MSIQFDFNKKFTRAKLEQFADLLKSMSKTIGFKVSSRGWCYMMEQKNFITKNQFDKVDLAINKLRKEGLIPVDFVAEEDARAFKGVEIPNTETDEPEIFDVLKSRLRTVSYGHLYYTADWWQGEEYYIQMLVEKIDLRTLFTPICKQYHIPIANAKGWSSILQRAEYARRFKEAESKGLKCVLLYCGDHDADGLRISDTLRKNIADVGDIVWSDGQVGYDPSDLIIKRFGLNYDFIIEHGYTWIDNLVTGSGMNLADPSHRNYKLDYVQDYLQTIGERKCEANAIVTTPEIAKKLVEDEIVSWLGEDARERFYQKELKIKEEYQELLDEYGLKEIISNILEE